MPLFLPHRGSIIFLMWRLLSVAHNFPSWLETVILYHWSQWELCFAIQFNNSSETLSFHCLLLLGIFLGHHTTILHLNLELPFVKGFQILSQVFWPRQPGKGQLGDRKLAPSSVFLPPFQLYSVFLYCRSLFTERSCLGQRSRQWTTSWFRIVIAGIAWRLDSCPVTGLPVDFWCLSCVSDLLQSQLCLLTFTFPKPAASTAV